MTQLWEADMPGVLQLPSGRLVRGRGISRPLPEGPTPALGVYLLATEPPAVPWESRWLPWPDFGLPTDRQQVLPVFMEVWERAKDERVEVACLGGRGRTGTALACLSVIDGVPPNRAVQYVRTHYNPRAVETLGQRRYVRRFRTG